MAFNVFFSGSDVEDAPMHVSPHAMFRYCKVLLTGQPVNCVVDFLCFSGSDVEDAPIHVSPGAMFSRVMGR